MFNSLIITVDGMTITYECHTYTEAMQILAGQSEVTHIIEKFELV